jgi:hypothetical protein
MYSPSPANGRFRLADSSTSSGSVLRACVLVGLLADVFSMGVGTSSSSIGDESRGRTDLYFFRAFLFFMFVSR